MRYLKSHQVPFQGFAWDHPLRARWREMGNLDPVVSIHLWREVLKLSLLRILFSTGLCLFFWLAVLAMHLQTILGTVGLVIAWGSSCVISLGDLPKIFREYRGTASKFTAAMEELAKVFGISTRQLGLVGPEWLRVGAKQELITDANRHLLKEQFFLPGAPEREQTRAIFLEHFNLFKKWGLIPEKETWTPFFEEARREMR